MYRNLIGFFAILKQHNCQVEIRNLVKDKIINNKNN